MLSNLIGASLSETRAMADGPSNNPHEDDAPPPPTKKQRLMPREENISSKALPSSQSCFRPDSQWPVKIVRGDGQYLFDSDERRFLDATGKVPVGHCHRTVVEAGHRQMSTLNTNSRFLNDGMVIFAKHLCATFPEGLDCCFFTNSGAEANDLAIQIARSVTGHKEVISLAGTCHGNLTSLKPLGNTKMTSSDLEASNVVIVPLPDPYRGCYQDSDKSVGVDDVMTTIKRAHSEGKTIAAFIHKTIFSDSYLPSAYACVREAGGLCIADEAVCGLGRTGRHFWGFEGQAVVPDIVTVGRALGNNHPVSVVVTTKKIAQQFSASGVEYFNTFGGNPVSMAVGNAVLSVLEEEGLQKQAQELGSQLLQGLQALMEKHSCIGDVRGLGLLVEVELVRDRETKEPDGELAERIMEWLLLDHSIIACVGGLHDNLIIFQPPLCISQDDCSDIVQAVDAVLGKPA